MTSPVLERPAAAPRLGSQEPRIFLDPPAVVSSAGVEAVELAARAGLILDKWQSSTLHRALGERADGRWAAFEVGLVATRQNGKDSILEARELAGLYLFGEKLIIHSAHEQITATEHFLRLLNLIEGCPDLDQRVRRVVRGKGQEHIELKDGARIFFKTRTSSGGRGLTGDLVVLNEAMIITLATMAALVPTMAARSKLGNPQLWYAGSAVDQQKHEHGHVLAGVRRRALAGEPGLAYTEFSIEGDDPDQVPPHVSASEEAWAQSNPGLGIRITTEHVANEHRALGPREFAAERLGVGDWPADVAESGVIDAEAWAELAEDRPENVSGPVFAFDVAPDRSSAAIGVAAAREDGLPQVEVADHDNGSGWVVNRCLELKDTYGTDATFFYDENSPAAALVREMIDVGLRVQPVKSREHADACGDLVAGVTAKSFRHDGYPGVAGALAGAGVRPLGDAWAWSRRASGVDITPLVVVTLALWAQRNYGGGGLVMEVFG